MLEPVSGDKDELLPAVKHIINSSLVSGVVPPEFKTAIVKPLPKKPSLDHNNLEKKKNPKNLSPGLKSVISL